MIRLDFIIFIRLIIFVRDIMRKQYNFRNIEKRHRTCNNSVFFLFLAYIPRDDECFLPVDRRETKRIRFRKRGINSSA